MPSPGDPFRRVVHGQDPPNQTAMWNRLLDLARVRDVGGAAGDVSDLSRDLDVIKVRNDSGAAVPRFGVLGLAGGGGPLVTPANNLPEFQRQPALSGQTPATGDAGQFCIPLEPLAAGAVGRAAVAGVVPVQVRVTGPLTGWAEVLSGDATQLDTVAAGGGSARVLWIDSSGGTRWALVRIGGAAPPAAQLLRVNGASPTEAHLYDATVYTPPPNGTTPAAGANAWLSNPSGLALTAGHYYWGIANGSYTAQPVGGPPPPATQSRPLYLGWGGWVSGGGTCDPTGGGILLTTY